MIYVSNRFIFLLYKYLPFVLVTIFSTPNIISDDSVLQKLLIEVILALIALLIFKFITSKIVEAEVSNECITITTLQKKIEWREVTQIDFLLFFQLYRLDTKDSTYYFPPYDISVVIFGIKLEDDFDLIINKKKRDYNI